MKKIMKICAVISLALLGVGMILALTAGMLRDRTEIAQIFYAATEGRGRLELGRRADGSKGGWGVYWTFAPNGFLYEAADDWDDRWDNDDDWDDDFYEDDRRTEYSRSGASSEAAPGRETNPYPEIGSSHETPPYSDESVSPAPSPSGAESSQSAAGGYYFPAEQVRSLDIQAGACHFEIKDSGEAAFSVATVGAFSRFRCYLEQGELHIEADAAKTVGVGVGAGVENSVTLYVPQGHSFAEADIEIGAGEFVCGSLTADHASLEAGAGSIKVQGPLRAGELDLSVDAGEMALSGMETQYLDAEVKAGDLTAQGSVTGNASLECNAGEIELRLEESQRDFNYQLSASAGSIHLGEESYSGFVREKRIDNGAQRLLEAECGMGSISIQFQ